MSDLPQFRVHQFSAIVRPAPELTLIGEPIDGASAEQFRAGVNVRTWSGLVASVIAAAPEGDADGAWRLTLRMSDAAVLQAWNHAIFRGSTITGVAAGSG